jgi:hypothetical protein
LTSALLLALLGKEDPTFTLVGSTFENFGAFVQGISRYFLISGLNVSAGNRHLADRLALGCHLLGQMTLVAVGLLATTNESLGCDHDFRVDKKVC